MSEEIDVYLPIKEKRLKYKISQTKLAEASNITKFNISAWELKKKVPSDEQIEAMDKALDKIIADIQNNKDIRKRRINHTSSTPKTLPKTIKTAQDYTKLLNGRVLNGDNPYKNGLSELYKLARQKKADDAPKAIDLFAGCGGLSLGFAAAGFNLVGHVEIMDCANKIYEENFPESQLLGTDICEISDDEIREWKKKFGKIDIMLGGPPCQGFSLAGKRDPADERNRLYRFYVHMISIIEPKVFLMENVQLLTSMKTPDGSLFIDHIVHDFSEAGYDVHRYEINAADYGVPQTRERIILVGIRKDENKDFVFPKPGFTSPTELDSQGSSLFEVKKPWLTFWDATSDLPKLESGESSSDPLHWAITHPEHVINWLKDVPEGHSAHENPDPNMRPPSGFNTTYKRIVWKEPCSTISTNFSMISGCRNVHPEQTRSLTIREATRAQSFPDEFVFTGKWGDIRKVIGNAVPPILAKCIADSVYKQFFKK